MTSQYLTLLAPERSGASSTTRTSLLLTTGSTGSAHWEAGIVHATICISRLACPTSQRTAKRTANWTPGHSACHPGRSSQCRSDQVEGDALGACSKPDTGGGSHILTECLSARYGNKSLGCTRPSQNLSRPDRHAAVFPSLRLKKLC